MSKIDGQKKIEIKKYKKNRLNKKRKKRIKIIRFIVNNDVEKRKRESI